LVLLSVLYWQLTIPMRNAAEADHGPAVVRHRRIALPVPDKAAPVLGTPARALDRIVLGKPVTAGHARVHRAARAQMAASMVAYNRAAPIHKAASKHEIETRAVAQTKRAAESAKARDKVIGIKRVRMLRTNGVSDRAIAIRPARIAARNAQIVEKRAKKNAPIAPAHGKESEPIAPKRALMLPAISQTIIMIIMVIGMTIGGTTTMRFGPLPAHS
jgi:hypothetical protein